jgi:signal peptidase I
MEQMFNKLIILAKVLYTTIIVCLVVIAGAVVISIFEIPGGFRLFTVQSGSMEPALKIGSLAIVKSQKDYTQGDIITVKDLEQPKETITHRVVEVTNANDGVFYTTKGDANNAPDTEKRSKDIVLGKVLLSIPYIGYPVSFAKTQMGFMLLVVIPATILVYSELIEIKNEIIKLKQKRDTKKKKSQEQSN